MGRESSEAGEHKKHSRLFGSSSSRRATRTSSPAANNNVSLLHGQSLVSLAFSLDEPLSSLDPELRAELRAELTRLQHTLTLTMVYVTHDPEDATALADHVVEMRAGRIVAFHGGQNSRQERA